MKMEMRDGARATVNPETKDDEWWFVTIYPGFEHSNEQMIPRHYSGGIIEDPHQPVDDIFHVKPLPHARWIVNKYWNSAI